MTNQQLRTWVGIGFWLAIMGGGVYLATRDFSELGALMPFVLFTWCSLSLLPVGNPRKASNEQLGLAGVSLAIMVGVSSWYIFLTPPASMATCALLLLYFIFFLQVHLKLRYLKTAP